MTSQSKCTLLLSAVGCLPLAYSPHASAQELLAANAVSASNPAPDAALLPDAPDASALAEAQDASQSQAPTNKTLGPHDAAQKIPPGPYQTKRILGIVPNFRAVSADVKLPPQTPEAKFKTALQDSFDYSDFIFVGMQAGISQATNSYPVFHQGAAGFGRYYWHTFADTLDENLWVEAIVPSAFHQDSRYYTLGHGGVLKRTAYSFTRSLITRGDNGNEQFNISEIVGAGAAAGVSSTYYPGQYRTWTKVGQRWLTSVLIDSGTSVAKEFWPDINSIFFHQKQ